MRITPGGLARVVMFYGGWAALGIVTHGDSTVLFLAFLITMSVLWQANATTTPPRLRSNPRLYPWGASQPEFEAAMKAVEREDVLG